MAALTTAALLAAGAGIGKGVAAFGQQRAQGAAMFGDAQEQRLLELRRMEEMNALGLDSDEEAALNMSLMSPVQAAQKEQFQRQAALMGQADNSGRGLTSISQQQEKLDAAQERVTAQIAMQDVALQRQREQEMRQLEGAESAGAAAKSAAKYALIGGIAEGASETYAKREAYNTLATSRTGLGDYDQFSKLLEMYGTTETK